VRLTLVNLNLDPGELQGCRLLQAAFAELGATAEVVHFRQPLPPADGLVLGPQGTPFSRYDADFLPWLRTLAETAAVPVLGVCGGMQALALAWGGRLGATFGGAIGQSYEGHRKLVGPVEVELQWAHMPAWLPTQGLRSGPMFQSHVEQVAELPGELRCVASSTPTPVEAFAHPSRRILASQFHPERGWDEGCDAGRAWLTAWLAVVQAGRRP
jgi:GMP synthase-like glutamine amidotransferase